MINLFLYMMVSSLFLATDTVNCLSLVYTDAIESQNYFHHGELFFIAFREIDLQRQI